MSSACSAITEPIHSIAISHKLNTARCGAPDDRSAQPCTRRYPEGGFYVHGVGIEAAVLPTGWQRRAIAARNKNTHDATGWCLEAHDLAVSKPVAWREQDRDFVRVLLAEEVVRPRKLILRIGQRPRHDRAPAQHRERMRTWVRGIVKDLGRAS
jgi:hypothetical protein